MASKLKKKSSNKNGTTDFPNNSPSGETDLSIAISNGDADSSKPGLTEEPESAAKNSATWDTNQNHGCYGYNDYEGCESGVITHEHLCVGDYCPICGSNYKLRENPP